MRFTFTSSRFKFFRCHDLAGIIFAAAGLVLRPVAVSAQPDTNRPLPRPQENWTWPEPIIDPTISTQEVLQLLGGPTLISFNAKGVATSDFVKLLFPDSNGINMYPRTGVRGQDIHNSLDVNWQGVPFWQAVFDVEKMNGMRWFLPSFRGFFPTDQTGGQNLNLGDGMVMANTPLVRLEANSILRESSVVRISKAPPTAPLVGEHRTCLSATAYLDPKLDYIFSELRTVSVKSAAGTKFYGNDEGRLTGRPNGRIDSFHYVTQLPLGLKSGEVLFRVNGFLRLKLISQTKIWNEKDLLSAIPTTLKAGPADASFEKASLEAGQLKLQLRIARPVNRRQESHHWELFNFFSRLDIRDGKGNILPLIKTDFKDGAAQGNYLSGPPVNGKYPGVAILTYRLSDYSGPISMEWRIPTEYRTFDTPFELRNVVMP